MRTSVFPVKRLSVHHQKKLQPPNSQRSSCFKAFLRCTSVLHIINHIAAANKTLEFIIFLGIPHSFSEDKWFLPHRRERHETEGPGSFDLPGNLSLGLGTNASLQNESGVKWVSTFNGKCIEFKSLMTNQIHLAPFLDNSSLR